MDSGLPEPVEQVAALCWRARPLPEVLLITSLNARRWIMPKGWPIAGKSLAESAAQEAFEEAGIRGEMTPGAIGHFHYLKAKKDGSALPVRVAVFALKVTGHRRKWPERGAREMVWLPLDQAAARVAEPGLRRILLSFRKSLAPQQRTA